MILTLGQPPTDTPLTVNNGEVDVSDNIQWTNWLSLIFNILINVGPQLRVQKVLNFPNTPAQDSSDLTIDVPGTVAGMPVALGCPLPPQGTTFTAYAGDHLVTVRFANNTAGAVDPPSGTFTAVVLTGEAT